MAREQPSTHTLSCCPFTREHVQRRGEGGARTVYPGAGAGACQPRVHAWLSAGTMPDAAAWRPFAWGTGACGGPDWRSGGPRAVAQPNAGVRPARLGLACASEGHGQRRRGGGFMIKGRALGVALWLHSPLLGWMGLWGERRGFPCQVEGQGSRPHAGSACHVAVCLKPTGMLALRTCGYAQQWRGMVPRHIANFFWAPYLSVCMRLCGFWGGGQRPRRAMRN